MDLSRLLWRLQPVKHIFKRADRKAEREQRIERAKIKTERKQHKEKVKGITNYERIHDMSKDELASYLGLTPHLCKMCAYCENDYCTAGTQTCVEGMRIWWGQVVGNDNHK